MIHQIFTWLISRIDIISGLLTKACILSPTANNEWLSVIFLPYHLFFISFASPQAVNNCLLKMSNVCFDRNVHHLPRLKMLWHFVAWSCVVFFLSLRNKDRWNYKRKYMNILFTSVSARSVFHCISNYTTSWEKKSVDAFRFRLFSSSRVLGEIFLRCKCADGTRKCRVCCCWARFSRGFECRGEILSNCMKVSVWNA